MPADGGLLREAPVALDALRSLPVLEGRFCAEVLPADRWATFEPLYVAALRGEESAIELDSIDGAARFMVEVGPLRDEAGDVIGGVMISRDVTAVRRLEAELRLRDELAGHLAAVVESSADAIISKTTEGMIVSWNRGAERLYGYLESEVKGRSISLLVPDGRDDEFAGPFARVAAGERVEQFETVRRCKDGSLVEVAVTMSPVRDSAGRVVGGATIARDITEQKRAERELAEARRDIDRFFGLSLDVMAIANDKGHFVRVNPAFEDTLGYALQDLTERPFAEFVHRMASIRRFSCTPNCWPGGLRLISRTATSVRTARFGGCCGMPPLSKMDSCTAPPGMSPIARRWRIPPRRLRSC